jgi:hypothetical protein
MTESIHDSHSGFSVWTAGASSQHGHPMAATANMTRASRVGVPVNSVNTVLHDLTLETTT